ncbi:hypothetical protein KC960_01100 [Candidatus Saccharibacteria bacterium]|nr:hypothetical protein [Candidatus Saccharibacteria bacterium]
MTDHDMSWTLTECQLASDFIRGSFPVASRPPDGYSFSYDGHDAITCFDEFHPEGIGVYGWLYGLSEAIYGNNIDQRRARELADAIEAQLEPTGSGRG